MSLRFDPPADICPGMMGWLALGLLPLNPGAAMVYLLATNFGLAFSDVIVVRVCHFRWLSCGCLHGRPCCSRYPRHAAAVLLAWAVMGFDLGHNLENLSCSVCARCPTRS